MTMTNAHPMVALLVRAGSRPCALPLASVSEIMRPLPIEPVDNMPPFLCGLSVVRGASVPVVDLGNLLGLQRATSIGRFVLLRLGNRQAVLGVDEVLGVRRFDGSELQTFPPLLYDSYAGLVSAIEVRDRQFLLVLEASRVVPEEVWQATVGPGGTR